MLTGGGLGGSIGKRSHKKGGHAVTVPHGGLVGGDGGGLVGLILLVRVACTAQAELAARMLPSLPGAIPMKAKLRERLADGGRGLLGERNPNPLADHLGKLPQAAVLLLEQGQNFFGGQGAVLLPCLGINRQPRVRLGRCGCGLRLRGLR